MRKIGSECSKVSKCGLSTVENVSSFLKFSSDSKFSKVWAQFCSDLNIFWLVWKYLKSKFVWLILGKKFHCALWESSDPIYIVLLSAELQPSETRPSLWRFSSATLLLFPVEKSHLHTLFGEKVTWLTKYAHHIDA